MLLVLLLPFTLLSLLPERVAGGALIEVLLLYLAIGRNSLGRHALRVREALAVDDLVLARQRLGLMVSRDTARLDQRGVAGAPGVVLYRLVNMLDAMCGYRNEHYHRFGWAAARLDDLLNFIPARLTAFSYALAGEFRMALRCWRKQGALWSSPNAGPVMAAGAGSLGVTIGGAACYEGVMQMRPLLGAGQDEPDSGAIARGLRLLDRALLIWMVVLFTGAWFAG